MLHNSATRGLKQAGPFKNPEPLCVFLNEFLNAPYESFLVQDAGTFVIVTMLSIMHQHLLSLEER